MAVEPRRACGFRKVGGLYLVSGGAFVGCDRLPLPLFVCPTCGHGFKQSRGWTWVDLSALVSAPHLCCVDPPSCPLCSDPAKLGRVGLLWVGAQFYHTPGNFLAEGKRLGFSRRVHAIPRDFVVGESWVIMAHPSAADCRTCGTAGLVVTSGTSGPTVCQPCDGTGRVAGVFMVWLPERIEQIVTQTQAGDAAFMAGLQRRKVTPVVVPDADADHKGTAYDHIEPIDDLADPITPRLLDCGHTTAEHAPDACPDKTTETTAPTGGESE